MNKETSQKPRVVLNIDGFAYIVDRKYYATFSDWCLCDDGSILEPNPVVFIPTRKRVDKIIWSNNPKIKTTT